MLVSLLEPRWWYMEIPRTGTTTIERGLRRVFTHAVAIYQKHWPRLPPDEFAGATSMVSIRNPYSRAVSCWQFFTRPGEISFSDWLRQRKEHGFTDIQIEARPQAFWYALQPCWDIVIQQENLDDDFWAAVRRVAPDVKPDYLQRFNDINGPWVNRVRARVKRNCPWQSYYDSESIALVQCVYAEDFTALADYYPLDFTEGTSNHVDRRSP